MKIPEDAYEVLRFYSWPGNIRELENVCERFSLFFARINRHDLSAYRETLIKSIGETLIIYDLFRKHGFKYRLENKTQDYNDALIMDLLNVFSEKKNKVAEILGIGRTTLWRILKTFHKEEQKID
jgi:propionate catabolism operon transcriptional regulator